MILQTCEKWKYKHNMFRAKSSFCAQLCLKYLALPRAGFIYTILLSKNSQKLEFSDDTISAHEMATRSDKSPSKNSKSTLKRDYDSF